MIEPVEYGASSSPGSSYGVSSRNRGAGSAEITVEALRAGAGKPPRQWLKFESVDELIEYEIPDDYVLMGDCHLTRGSITILGGWPGVGKSRAALGMAIAGARGVDWMGHSVHSRFRTLILQCENGRVRLKQELREAAPTAELRGWVHVTAPPPYGLAFREAGFRAALAQQIREHRPGLLVIDPWNRVADGDKQTDYREALDAIHECLPEDPAEKPAMLIVHHMRKKGSESVRKTGRDLLHELAGSYQIGSSARCVFALEPASTRMEDDRVVLTCCKNNDGREGKPSAWQRRNGLFTALPDFDMEAFHTGEGSGTAKDGQRRWSIPFETVAKHLRGMRRESKGRAAGRLIDAGVCERSKAYMILKEFSAHLEEDEEGKLWWVEDPSETIPPGD